MSGRIGCAVRFVPISVTGEEIMSLTTFALYAFLLCVVGPILLAARVLYSKQRTKLIKNYWR